MEIEPSNSSLAFMIRALRYRNYRLFYSGQIVSLIGTWMTEVATGWLVYRLTGSPRWLAIVSFAHQFPLFVFAPVAGMYIDRFNKRRTLVATQAAVMILSFILAALTLSGHVTIGLLIGLSILRGVVYAVDMPCRLSFVATLIERKEDMSNAIALNSSMVNSARLLGPSIGGLVISAVGEGWCFFIDGVSFLAVIAALLAMRVPEEAKTSGSVRGGAMENFREGWRYTRRSRPIRSLILLLALISIVGTPYTVLVPVFAGKVLHGGPHTLGFLMASAGMGALMASVYLASRKSILGLGRVIALAAGAFGAGLIAFSFSRSMWLCVPLLMLVGFGFITEVASSHTILQIIVDEDKRGRVMSFYTMAYFGGAPFGGILAGVLAERIGVPITLAGGGALCILGALWFASQLPELRKDVRPIYVRLGILGEEAGT